MYGSFLALLLVLNFLVVCVSPYKLFCLHKQPSSRIMLTVPTQLGAIRGSAISLPFQATHYMSCDLSPNSTPYHSSRAWVEMSHLHSASQLWVTEKILQTYLLTSKRKTPSCSKLGEKSIISHFIVFKFVTKMCIWLLDLYWLITISGFLAAFEFFTSLKR